MPNANYFGGEDIVPKGLEKHLTYSSEDDQDIFPLQRVTVRDVFQALESEISKQIDSECYFADIPFLASPIIDVSAELLLYLVSYFYARFCYLSPYIRPYFTLEETKKRAIHLKMSIPKGLFARFPHLQALIRKANRLSKIGNFSISIKEKDDRELMYFRLSAKKTKNAYNLYTYPLVYVAEYVDRALAAVKEDVGEDVRLILC